MALKRALIFLGPPGAGKGTQAKRVAQNCGILHLSTGDAFRDAIRRDTELGHRVRPIVERGELVPDQLVIEIVRERLSRPDCDKGFVFDGFPRTLPQAEQLDGILSAGEFEKLVVVDFCVSEEKLLRRLTGRRTCSVGGEIYNIYDAPPKVPEVCDHDGGKLVQRSDDRPDVVRKRLRAYELQTKPLEEYYRRRSALQALDASQSVEEVGRALDRILGCTEGRDGRL